MDQFVEHVVLESAPKLEEHRENYHTDFLWDGLYSSVESFALALAREDLSALARLVSRVGLFEGALVAGNAVWTEFAAYERRLAPGRRKELRKLWQRQSELGLI